MKLIQSFYHNYEENTYDAVRKVSAFLEIICSKLS